MLEALINRAMVKSFKRSHRRELENNDTPRLPIALVDLVRATAGKVTPTRLLQRRLHLAHEVLVTRRVVNLDIENDVSRHKRSCREIGRHPDPALASRKRQSLL